MKNSANENGTCKKVREDVIETCMIDKNLSCPLEKIQMVLKDWNRVMQKFEEISVATSHRMFVDSPETKIIFPTLAELSNDELLNNEDFLYHARAVLRGLNSVMQNLSAKYEEDNEILPVISETHAKRGVTCNMMKELKVALIKTCFKILNLPISKRRVWETVMNFIFVNYNTETENHLKKLFLLKKSARRSSLAEVHETNYALRNSRAEVKSQITSPIILIRKQSIRTTSPTLSDRRPSRAFLHPDHAKLMVKRSSLLTPPSERFSLSFEDSRSTQNGIQTSPASSSAASSILSLSNGPAPESQYSDPIQNYESRRSSTMTNRYSILDAHDLEYALIKTAARGSIGPYSLSQSLQKLTFTQSLAFPELARGVSNKRNASRNNARNKLNPLESGVNAFAKVATALLLVLISVLVFGVLYKFIRT